MSDTADPTQLTKTVTPSDSVAVEIARLRLAETMCRTHASIHPFRIAEAFHRIVKAAERPSTEIRHD